MQNPQTFSLLAVAVVTMAAVVVAPVASAQNTTATPTPTLNDQMEETTNTWVPFVLTMVFVGLGLAALGGIYLFRSRS